LVQFGAQQPGMIKCQILYKKFNNDKKQVLNSQLLTTITNNKLSLLIITKKRAILAPHLVEFAADLPKITTVQCFVSHMFRWRNYMVRFLLTWVMIFGFFGIIWLGPVALVILVSKVSGNVYITSTSSSLIIITE
jgi:hypothetical protein